MALLANACRSLASSLRHSGGNVGLLAQTTRCMASTSAVSLVPPADLNQMTFPSERVILREKWERKPESVK